MTALTICPACAECGYDPMCKHPRHVAAEPAPASEGERCRHGPDCPACAPDYGDPPELRDFQAPSPSSASPKSEGERCAMCDKHVNGTTVGYRCFDCKSFRCEDHAREHFHPTILPAPSPSAAGTPGALDVSCVSEKYGRHPHHLAFGHDLSVCSRCGASLPVKASAQPEAAGTPGALREAAKELLIIEQQLDACSCDDDHPETLYELRRKVMTALDAALAAQPEPPSAGREDPYEYRTTTGQRKAWDGEPDLTKEGWVEYQPWERFEFHEERYWRRLRTSGVELIAAERRRQVEKEGWTAAHDDEHVEGEMAGGAASYAAAAQRDIAEGPLRPGNRRPPLQTWRWSSDWWKPTGDPVRDLVKAGALVAAEIDRLLRAKKA